MANVVRTLTGDDIYAGRCAWRHRLSGVAVSCRVRQFVLSRWEIPHSVNL